MSVLSQCHSSIFDQGISASGHGKEVVYGTNTIDKGYMYQLLPTVQLPGSKIFEKQILLNSCTQQRMSVWLNNSRDICIMMIRKHGVIDQGKERKKYSKRKCKCREYHVQDNSDFAHKYVKIYCDTNQFPELSFCGSHPKPHGSRGLGKNYHIRFDPSLGHGICAIRHIPCACVACTSMFDQPWISGVQSTEQASYQTVINCTYCPVLVPYNNCNIINIKQKSIPFETFDEIRPVFLDRIIENTASLFQLGMYGAINRDDTTTNGFYVIKFLSYAYTQQSNTTIDEQVIYSGELFFKAKYL